LSVQFFKNWTNWTHFWTPFWTRFLTIKIPIYIEKSFILNNLF